MNPNGEWNVANWIPLLFDISTGVLFIGGCLLLWLNFSPRRRTLLAPQETAEPRIEETIANARLEARHFSKVASEEPLEPAVENATPASPSSKQTVGAEWEDLGGQNSYAGHIALAMKKVPNQK